MAQERYEGTEEPLFVDETEDGRVRDDKPIVERNAIMAIVKHWSDDTYMGLRWKKVAWDTLITGGVDDGQTAEEAARREIEEETGYKHLKLVRTLTTVHSKFFHTPKDENRLAHFTVFYFELEDGEHDAMTEDEQAKHDVLWLSKDEMESFNLPPAHRFSWDEFLGQ